MVIACLSEQQSSTKVLIQPLMVWVKIHGLLAARVVQNAISLLMCPLWSTCEKVSRSWLDWVPDFWWNSCPLADRTRLHWMAILPQI